jgi:DNA-directed RNA polymerase subunit beta'
MPVYREMEPKVDVPEDEKKKSVYSIADIEKKLAAADAEKDKGSAD